MIREQDLHEAIAECLGERNPNASTCIKLAAYYTIKDNLYPVRADAEESSQPVRRYSFADEPAGRTIEYDSGTEFSEAVRGRDSADVWPVMDELMTALKTMVPRLYDGVMRRLIT